MPVYARVKPDLVEPEIAPNAARRNMRICWHFVTQDDRVSL